MLKKHKTKTVTIIIKSTWNSNQSCTKLCNFKYSEISESCHIRESPIWIKQHDVKIWCRQIGFSQAKEVKLIPKK